MKKLFGMTLAILCVTFAFGSFLSASDLSSNTDASVQQQKIYKEAQDKFLRFESERPESKEELIKNEAFEDDSEKLIRLLNTYGTLSQSLSKQSE